MAKSYRECAFVAGVLCSHRRSKKFSINKYCLSCPKYEQFMRSMDAEDEKVMDEIDKIRSGKIPY